MRKLQVDVASWESHLGNQDALVPKNGTSPNHCLDIILIHL